MLVHTAIGSLFMPDREVGTLPDGCALFFSRGFSQSLVVVVDGKAIGFITLERIAL